MKNKQLKVRFKSTEDGSIVTAFVPTSVKLNQIKDYLTEKDYYVGNIISMELVAI